MQHKKTNGFRSLQRRRLFEEVAASLKQAIFSGKYRVGDKLPSETELAGLFQVSRPVVREAIRYLEITGLLTIRQGAKGGAFVTGINSRVLKENVLDLLAMGQVSVSQLTQVRQLIGPEIARLAAQNADEDDIRELETSIILSQQDHGLPEGLDQVENNARFHRIMARVSQNLFFAIIEDVIMDFTIEFIRTVQTQRQILHDPEDHDHIYQAVVTHDPERAAAATRKHIKKIGIQMKELEDVFLSLSNL